MPGSAWKGGGVSKHEMFSSANDQILTTLKQEWDSIKFLNGWLKFLFGDVKLVCFKGHKSFINCKDTTLNGMIVKATLKLVAVVVV